MFSQSTCAQLMRMSLLLLISLWVVQLSPSLRDFLATYAIDSGCHQHHQMTGQHEAHSHHHHHHH